MSDLTGRCRLFRASGRISKLQPFLFASDQLQTGYNPAAAPLQGLRIPKGVYTRKSDVIQEAELILDRKMFLLLRENFHQKCGIYTVGL